MIPLLWILFLPHLTISSTLIYLLLNEYYDSVENDRLSKSKALRKFTLELRKSADRRYLKFATQSASPMRQVAISSLNDIKCPKLKILHHLIGESGSFNLNSPLVEFVRNNAAEIISNATMRRYNYLIRQPRKQCKLHTINTNELQQILCNFNKRRLQRKLYRRKINDNTGKISMKAGTFTSPLSRTIRHTIHIARSKQQFRFDMLNSPLRKFMNARQCETKTILKPCHYQHVVYHRNQMRDPIALGQYVTENINDIKDYINQKTTRIESPLRRFHEEIRVHAQNFLNELETKQRYKDLFSMAVRETAGRFRNLINRQIFKTIHNIPDVEFLPESKTIFTIVFPTDKVYCHRFLADCNIEGFEVHIEYLTSDKIVNYCTMQLNNLSPNEILDFTRNFICDTDCRRVMVQTDKLNMTSTMTSTMTVNNKTILTCDFSHRESISPKAFEKYQKSCNGQVTYINKYHSNMIRAVMELDSQENTIEKHKDQLMKKFKGLICQGSSVKQCWIDIQTS